MTHREDVLLHAIAQEGDRYIFGAEARPTDPDPKAFDCSELVEWSCARAGVAPRMPDGAIFQMLHCRNNGTLIPVAEAIAVRGALLFRITTAGNHVAFSLGNGTTIEAKGAKWGVGVFPSAGRGWTHGGLMPGVSYLTAAAPPPFPIPEPTPMEFSPPLVLEPLASDMACPQGGTWLLGVSGAIYAFGGCAYYGGGNTDPDFIGRTAAQLVPSPDPSKAYRIVATSGETYDYPRS